MGFQIRSANPCVVHAVTKGGMAMNAGLVRGQALLKVNGKNVMNDSHDEVAGAIRDGCKQIAEEGENRKNKEEKEKEDEEKFEEVNFSLFALFYSFHSFVFVLQSISLFIEHNKKFSWASNGRS